MTNALWLAILQSLITIGAVVLLWSLHLRLVDRPVFKWWAWAWTSFALYLGVGSLAVPLSPEWTLPKITVVVLGAVFGFLPPPLLVFGARSMLSPDLPTRREQRLGLAFVMALGVTTILLSLWWSDPIESFYVRIAPRTLLLAAALLYCAWVFLSQWRLHGSRASLITGGVCAVYGVTQSIYGAALVGRLDGCRRPEIRRRSDHRVATTALSARSRQRVRDLHRAGVAVCRRLPALAAGAAGERRPSAAGRRREPGASGGDRRAAARGARAAAVRGKVRCSVSLEPVPDG